MGFSIGKSPPSRLHIPHPKIQTLKFKIQIFFSIAMTQKRKIPNLTRRDGSQPKHMKLLKVLDKVIFRLYV